MLSVIVPYRDRAEHLAAFKPAVYNYLKENLDCEFEIMIIEQAGNDPFNRAKLLNIGASKCGIMTDYLCFHDVDHIPIKVDYCYKGEMPVQLVSSTIQIDNYLGGVTLFSVSTFNRIGGFSNHFWGWGGEDNEICFRIFEKGIGVVNRFGEWKILDHVKSGKFDIHKWRQAQKPRMANDNCFEVDYTDLNLIQEPEFNLRHFLVEI
jgi:predicted glycosyltransferase involved in capsule biosynthesis